MIKILVSKKEFPEDVRLEEVLLYVKYYDPKRDYKFQIVKKDICIVIEEEELKGESNE